MELLHNVKQIYLIYFTSYPQTFYFKAGRSGNFDMLGISEGLVNAQYTFWISNIGIIFIIYHKNNSSLFYNNIFLFIVCLYLYVFSLRKAIYLSKFLKQLN